MLGAEERAGEIGVDDVAPFRAGMILRRLHIADLAGVVEGDVEPAEMGDRAVDERFGVRFVGHVAVDRDRFAAFLFDFVDESVEFVAPAAGDDQLCAFAREEQRGGAADAGACAGDDGDFVCELHDEKPPDRAALQCFNQSAA